MSPTWLSIAGARFAWSTARSTRMSCWNAPMLLETLRLALFSIWRNALRSLLTLLGVTIGVAAVIAMVTLGQGATAQVSNSITSLGSNLLVVRPGQMTQ